MTVCPATVMVPDRDEDDVFAVTEKFTNPVPVMELPSVTVIHDALLAADHEQLLPVFTAKLPVPAADATDTAVADSAYVHDALKVNGLDRVLCPAPPGPTAETRASSMLPPAKGQLETEEARSTLIRPFVPGVGLPSALV